MHRGCFLNEIQYNTPGKQSEKAYFFHGIHKNLHVDKPLRQSRDPVKISNYEIQRCLVVI